MTLYINLILLAHFTPYFSSATIILSFIQPFMSSFISATVLMDSVNLPYLLLSLPFELISIILTFLLESHTAALLALAQTCS